MNLRDLIRPCLLDLKPYSSARDEYTGSEGVFLDANENPYGDLNRYPDPYQRELKEKLAQRRGVNAANIFVGNGSDEVIDLCYRLFCEPGRDKALQFSPTYGMYKVSAGINNVSLLDCPLNGDFQIDLKAADKLIRKERPKLIFVCSPNNPSGNLIDKKTIKALTEVTEGIVIVDEAYIDFAIAESCISMLPECENLIVTQTFSKAWGLAAARVGVAYAGLRIVNLLSNIKPPYNVSGLNQKAAIKALDDSEGFERRMAAILKEKQRLIDFFEQLPLVTKVYPSQANFILIALPEAAKWYQRLIEQKIITRNRSSVVADTLRITVGTPEENNKLINALEQ